MLTWKYALPAFLVPFMFTQPDGIAILLRDSSIGEAALATISAAVGITALVTGVGGHLLRRASVPERVILVVAGLLLLYPSGLTDAIGLALFAVAVALQAIPRPSARPA